MRIQIVGLGGIGSSLVQPLAKFLRYDTEESEYDVLMIDHDTVEEGNLSRQAFVSSDIHAFKSQVMAEEFESKFSALSHSKSLNVGSVTEPLSKKNIEDLIRDDSITFCGVDNYVTRVLLEKHICQLNNAIAIFGGNFYHDGDVNIVSISDGESVFPLYTEKHPELIEKMENPIDERSCDEVSKSAPQLVLANQMAAQLMMGAFYQHVKKNLDWHEVMFDIDSGNVRFVRD